MRFLELDPRTLVADAQLQPADVAEAAAQRRHDDRQQPSGRRGAGPAERRAEIEAAAEAAGIDYRVIPVARRHSPSDRIDGDGGRRLATAEGRSLLLPLGNPVDLPGALARAGVGDEAEALVAKAAAAPATTSARSWWLNSRPTA